MLLLSAKRTKQTGRQKVNYQRRCGISFDGSDIPVGNALYLDPNPTKDESRPHQLGTKMLPGIFIGYARNSGGGWAGDLIIPDWLGIENNVASEVPAKRVKSKEVGNQETAGGIRISLRMWFLRQEVRAQRQILRHQRVEIFDVGGVLCTMGLARMSLCRAQEITLCKKRDRVADCLKLIATPCKQKKISGVCLENWIFATMSREQLYVPTEPSFPIPSKIRGRRAADRKRFGRFAREQHR